MFGLAIIFAKPVHAHLLLHHDIFDCTHKAKLSALHDILFSTESLYRSALHAILFPAENSFSNLHPYFIICNELLSISKNNTLFTCQALPLSRFPIVESFERNVSNSRHFFHTQKWLLWDIFQAVSPKLSNSSNLFPIVENFETKASDISHFWHLPPLPFQTEKPKLPGRSPPAACFYQAGEPGAHGIWACMTAKSWRHLSPPHKLSAMGSRPKMNWLLY